MLLIEYIFCISCCPKNVDPQFKDPLWRNIYSAYHDYFALTRCSTFFNGSAGLKCQTVWRKLISPTKADPSRWWYTNMVGFGYVGLGIKVTGKAYVGEIKIFYALKTFVIFWAILMISIQVALLCGGSLLQTLYPLAPYKVIVFPSLQWKYQDQS